jgi:hypothetical protein
MHKNATKCNKTQSKWCENKHGSSKIIDTFETYHWPTRRSWHIDDPGAADPLVASVFHIRETPSWVEPFSNYLITRDLPQDAAEARQLQRRAHAYTIINSELYKCSVSRIFQKCIEPEEGKELLKEIHQGECGHHASSRALVAKASRHSFY